MAKIEEYENLKWWQKARLLVNQVYRLVEHSGMEHEYALSDQLKRASISVMTNIAEGFTRYHRGGDFIWFLDYAQSSAQEVKSFLYIVLDQKNIDPEKVKELQELCDYCQTLTLALLKHVKQSIGNDSQKTTEPEVYYLEENFVEL